MGDTTDELLDLAHQVSPLPPGRELDMLLTAGERISMALLAMAIHNLGLRGPLVHRLAGRRDHHLGARQGPDHRRHPGPDPRTRSTRARSRSSPASRASPRTPRTSPRWAAAARTPPRWRWPPRWTPTSARSTPTWTASSPPTRGSCRSARQMDTDHLRGDAGAGRLRRQGAAPAVAWSTPGGTACRSTSARRTRQQPGTLVTGSIGGPPRGAGAHHRRRARPQRGQDHHRRRAGRARRGRARSSARSPTPRSTST